MLVEIYREIDLDSEKRVERDLEEGSCEMESRLGEDKREKREGINGETTPVR